MAITERRTKAHIDRFAALLREGGRVSETLTIFERSSEGRRAFTPPPLDVPEVPVADLLPESAIRKEPAELPEVSEPEIVRHYNRLSKKNFDLDTRLLPARLVHDEAQPEAARAGGGAARATRGCTRSRTRSARRARSS